MNKDIKSFREKAEQFQNNTKKKAYIFNEIKYVRDLLQDAFLKKVKSGKINKEHITPYLKYLEELVKDFNGIQIYEIKQGIVIPRDLRTFPEFKLETELNKGNCQKNLEQLSKLKY